MNQEEAKKLMETIYTPEKKAIWKKKMDIAGEKWINKEIVFEEYMEIRKNLRKELGFPP